MLVFAIVVLAACSSRCKVDADCGAGGACSRLGNGCLRVVPGTHKLVVQASDYQEAKNNENVAAITPNTATAARSVVVR